MKREEGNRKGEKQKIQKRFFKKEMASDIPLGSYAYNSN